MAYEQRENTGSLFRNDKKQQFNHPDYKGQCLVNGVEMWLSAWLKDTKDGRKFMSLSFSPKEQQVQQPQQQAQSQPSNDIPF